MLVLGLLLLGTSHGAHAQDFTKEAAESRDQRMNWWREARFGMFIHWGLYAVPAGEWKGKTDYGEWIRTSAEIPLREYEQFVPQFNPVKFDASSWVRMAKDAGMKYIVITTKHHDGFCLFDSRYTDFDVMSTPFHHDIMKELSDACRKEGLTICWYHSIMDWHHPDYVPRREWETDRPSGDAVFSRYVLYLKNQLKELLTHYGPIGVLWFDGEWESTWNKTLGRDLYNYVRGLQPDIIINNRVGAGRSGMEGFNKGEDFAGDFGTPEQEIPSTGLPGVYWETCMTMNDHWGYNSHDLNFKTTTDLLRKLADIASKGGNFLLNVGPRADGTFPPTSIERLKEIGAWMHVNGESIYGTSAGPFKNLPWGRCTQKEVQGGRRLYLHVFDWPRDGRLIVPGILNEGKRATLLADPSQKRLSMKREEDAIVIAVPVEAPDVRNSVVVLEIAGEPDISDPPVIDTSASIFTNSLDVAVKSMQKNVDIRCTLDGSIPSTSSPVIQAPLHLTQTTVVSARAFRGERAVSGVAQAAFRKVAPNPPVQVSNPREGIAYAYFEPVVWDSLADFRHLTPSAQGFMDTIALPARHAKEYYGLVFDGLVRVPADGVYTFFTESDDGSRLYVDGSLVVDNDKLHGMVERKGMVALGSGLHVLRMEYFQKTGEAGLKASMMSSTMMRTDLGGSLLFHAAP
ncbi:MAG TPA: alpha-L-fucosidase [Bacteroidota bacterium]|nr:alpha-L-fucosidase [Bacteroidota bacterium]